MQQYSGLGGIAYRGEHYVRGVFDFDARALPSGAETSIPMTGHTGYGMLDVAGNTGAFHVGGDGTYSYLFFIPVQSGASGGNITVSLKSNGDVLETWILTVPDSSRVMLSGTNFDPIASADILTMTLNHSNGNGWAIADTGFFITELVRAL